MATPSPEASAPVRVTFKTFVALKKDAVPPVGVIYTLQPQDGAAREVYWTINGDGVRCGPVYFLQPDCKSHLLADVARKLMKDPADAVPQSLLDGLRDYERARAIEAAGFAQRHG